MPRAARSRYTKYRGVIFIFIFISKVEEAVLEGKLMFFVSFSSGVIKFCDIGIFSFFGSLLFLQAF